MGLAVHGPPAQPPNPPSDTTRLARRAALPRPDPVGFTRLPSPYPEASPFEQERGRLVALMAQAWWDRQHPIRAFFRRKPSPRMIALYHLMEQDRDILPPALQRTVADLMVDPRVVQEYLRYAMQAPSEKSVLNQVLGRQPKEQ